MNSVLIVIPQNADKEEIINSLTAVLNELTKGDNIFRPGFHMFNLNPECIRISTVCDNLIKKLGHPSVNSSITWVSSFFQAYYDVTDADITTEVVEYIANVEGEIERNVMVSKGLDFLIPICRDMCNKNR